MWRILKAEIDYNKYILLFPVVIIIPLLIAYLLQTQFKFARGWIALLLILTPLLVLIMTYKVIKKPDEQRDRFHVLLPVSTSRIGVVRLLPALSIWIGMAVMLAVCHLFSGTYNTFKIHELWGALSGNAICLILFVLKIIDFDLQFLFKKEHVILKNHQDALTSLLVAWFVSGVGYYYMMISVMNPKFFVLFYFTLFLSLPGALIANSICLLLFLISVKIFVRRRSFLE